MEQSFDTLSILSLFLCFVIIDSSVEKLRSIPAVPAGSTKIVSTTSKTSGGTDDLHVVFHQLRDGLSL